MARPRTVQLQTLFDNLPAGGVVSAADLVDRLGVTRTTLSRLVAEAGDRVVRLGRTRATAYAVRQQTAAGSEWPLFRLRPDATLEELGSVVALTGETFHVSTTAARPNLTRSPDETRRRPLPGAAVVSGRPAPTGLPRAHVRASSRA